jgi:hypothetical protein
MQYRVRRRFLAIACVLFLTACGGGGGGGTPVTPTGPSPAPQNTQTPPGTSNSTTFSLNPAPASVTLPSGSAVSGAITLPVMTGSGNVTLTTYSGPPSGVPVLNVRSRRMSAAASGTSLNNALLYFSLTPSQAITLQGAPGFGLNFTTAPSGNVYLAQYSGQWNAISAAAAFQGNGASLVAASLGTQSITIAAGKTAYFAIFVSELSGINIALTAPLAMASPGTYSRVAVEPYDANGNAISGNLPQPITITDLDSTGHTSFSGNTTISTTAQWVPLTFDGHGDNFVIAANMGAFRSERQFVTTLEKEHATANFTQAGLQYFGQPVLGPDGNFWVGYASSVWKITPSAQLTQYTDPNGQLAYQGNAPMTAGADGNLWVAGWDSNTESGGISRMTPAGSFTDFPFTGTLKSSSSSVGEMVKGPDGAVWFTAGSPDYGEPGVGIGRIDSSGNITLVAPLPNAPTNLIVGPDGNLWFVEGANVDKMSTAGAITSYTLPASSSQGQLHFVLGSDGNFWAPFAYGQQTLLKFSTNGTVVSTTPLLYTALWYPYNQGAATAPLGQSMVSDPSGYVYLTDVLHQGVLRIDGSGNITAYPSYSTTLNIAEEPMYIVRGTDGNVYLASIAILGFTQAEIVQAFTMLDTSLWGGGNAGGVTGAGFVPPPATSPPPVYITAVPASVSFMDVSGTQKVTLQPANPSATLSIDGSTCAGIATVSQSSATTFNFAAAGVGTCEVTAADNAGHSIVIPVSVQTTSVWIQ